MGKIMECGALCAEPVGRNVTYLRRDHFEIEPKSGRALHHGLGGRPHALRKDPSLPAGRPGGTLDPSNCKYEQVTDRRVRVSGSRFEPAKHYTVKLEGAKTSGWRSIIAGARDPIFIAQIDTPRPGTAGTRAYFAEVPKESSPHHSPPLRQERRDGRARASVKTPRTSFASSSRLRRPPSRSPPRSAARRAPRLMHSPYSGRIATAGNLASPFTPRRSARPASSTSIT